MKLSVIIPVYNAERFLEKCVKSVLEAPIQDMEIWLINDGSSDHSEQICRQFEESDPRVHVLAKANAGVAAARNSGLEKAEGEYVMFLDADDFMASDGWKEIVRRIGDGYDFYAFSYWSLFENGAQIKEPFPEECKGKETGKAYRILLGTPLLHTCWGKLFKRTILESYGIRFPEGIAIGEDYLFVLEYFRYIKTCCICNEAVLYYRQNDSGAMKNFSYQTRLDNIKRIWMRCSAYITENGLEQYRKDMELYQFYSFSSFCRVIAEKTSIKRSAGLYRAALKDDIVDELMASVPEKFLKGKRTLEYRLLRKSDSVIGAFLAACYFRGKAKIKELAVNMYKKGKR